MEMIEIMRVLLYGAGVVAILALAWLFWRLSKTLDVLDTTLIETNETVAELKEKALPLLDKASVTVDSVNAEMIRIDEIITSVENATKKVENTSSSITEFVNAPVEAVTDFAGRIRHAFKERRAEVKDAHRARSTGQYDDEDFESADEARAYLASLDQSVLADLGHEIDTDEIVYVDASEIPGEVISVQEIHEN